jgi:hypothetical protein
MNLLLESKVSAFLYFVIFYSLLSRRRSLRFAQQTGKLRSERGGYRISQDSVQKSVYILNPGLRITAKLGY